MNRSLAGRNLILCALVAIWILPLSALGQETTTTTIEIETSATSITTTTTTVADSSGDNAAGTTGDTLPFTGASTGGLAGAAYVALVAGILLVALSRRSPGADSDPQAGPQV